MSEEVAEKFGIALERAFKEHCANLTPSEAIGNIEWLKYYVMQHTDKLIEYRYNIKGMK